MTGLTRDEALESEVWQWLNDHGPTSVVKLRRATGCANNQIVSEALTRLEEEGAVVADRADNTITLWRVTRGEDR